MYRLNRLTLGLLLSLHTLAMHAVDCEINAESYRGLELSNLERELSTNGLIGHVHGAQHSQNLYVLTVRDPDNFFSHMEISLVVSSKIAQQFRSFKRHDRVCLKGRLTSISPKQPHISVQEAHLLSPWTDGYDLPAYSHKTRIPEDLEGLEYFSTKVHARIPGKLLVVEFGDSVLPVSIPEDLDVSWLFRGDIVQLPFELQTFPKKPQHLRIPVGKAITMLDSMVAQHGQEIEVVGSLVLFPKSPQLNFDIFALEVNSGFGLFRNYTLVNFEDPEFFETLRNHLSAIWDSQLPTVERGRNMLVNREIKLQISGVANVVSPNQANPQILINSLDQINLR